MRNYTYRPDEVDLFCCEAMSYKFRYTNHGVLIIEDNFHRVDEIRAVGKWRWSNDKHCIEVCFTNSSPNWMQARVEAQDAYSALIAKKVIE